jgi:AraC family transcriptional regulator of adaptative response/methylated-DNA-[protein]-cysteine methyltransferase
MKNSTSSAWGARLGWQNRAPVLRYQHNKVIRADGTLCGYAGGLWRKQRLLDHERKYKA